MNKTTIAFCDGAEIEVFFDGACPLCRREMEMLRNKDRQQKIHFIDIAAKDFVAEHYGLTQDALMDRIHARLPDGQLIDSVEVFRKLYAMVGYRYLVGFSRWPGVTQALDWGYKVFAKNRMRMTGRCDDRGCDINSAV